MSGYLFASPDTSRVSMLGSLSRMKSARTGSKASGFTSGTDPSPSFDVIGFGKQVELQQRVIQCLTYHFFVCKYY